MKRLLLAASLLALGCGSAVEKDGTPANSGANAAPGLNSSIGGGGGGGGRMEQGSPQSEVIAAYNRFAPLMCAYDATCAEPLLADACPLPTGTAPPGGQCWVVDQAKLSVCEGELRGAQCQGQWQNFPLSCGEAIRACACLDGAVQAWTDDGEMGCFDPCVANQCDGGLACYDGACMPPQEDRCPDGQSEEFGPDGEWSCYVECRDGTTCEDGFACDGFVCRPTEE